MAEAGGLAIGIFGLAGLFSTTVQCFEFIQLGRAFEKTFQTSQLKLDNLRLRLSRWGNSLGLSNNLHDNPHDAALLENRLGPQAIEHARSVLGQILLLFADAESISHKFKSRTTANDSRLATFDPQVHLDSATVELHNKIHQLSVARQNRTGLRQKAKWALYEEKSLRRLIEDVTKLIDGLVELFPAHQELQRRLCEVEVSTMGAYESMPVLRDVAAKQDRFLEDAISRVANKGQTYNNVFSGSHNAGLQLGHNSGAITIGAISGNRYGKAM